MKPRSTWLTIGLATMLAGTAAYGQVAPSLPPAPAPDRGVPPLPGGASPGPNAGAPPTVTTPGIGVLRPPPVDPGMTLHRAVPDGPMPVIRPQAVQPDGTVVVPK